MSAPDTMAERLEGLLADATPEPWWVAGKGTIRRGKMDWIAKVNWRNKEANTALIVAAVNALPTLLAERKAMREALAFIAEGRNAHGVPHAGPESVSAARQALKGQTNGE